VGRREQQGQVVGVAIVVEPDPGHGNHYLHRARPHRHERRGAEGRKAGLKAAIGGRHRSNRHRAADDVDGLIQEGDRQRDVVCLIEIAAQVGRERVVDAGRVDGGAGRAKAGQRNGAGDVQIAAGVVIRTRRRQALNVGLARQVERNAAAARIAIGVHDRRAQQAKVTAGARLADVESRIAGEIRGRIADVVYREG
jgi:hypothetical protein